MGHRDLLGGHVLGRHRYLAVVALPAMAGRVSIGIARRVRLEFVSNDHAAAAPSFINSPDPPPLRAALMDVADVAPYLDRGDAGWNVRRVCALATLRTPLACEPPTNAAGILLLRRRLASQASSAGLWLD